MRRQAPGTLQIATGSLLFAVLALGAEIGSGMELHAAIAVAAVSAMAFGIMASLWRLVRGG